MKLILDSCPSRTYVTRVLEDRLGVAMENEQEFNLITFGNLKSKAIKTVTSLCISLKWRLLVDISNCCANDEWKYSVKSNFTRIVQQIGRT